MNQPEKLTLAFLVLLAFSYIISASYLGLSETRLTKQADVYGHILGWMGFKNFAPFDLFNPSAVRSGSGGKAIWNGQAYEFIVAKISIFLNSNPLVVVRFVNFFCWLPVAYCGFLLARAFSGSIAGIVFVFLLATSPLFLFYASVPHPDMMAVAFSIIAITLLYFKGINWRAVLYAFPFLALATFIKSPIPFVFLLFYGSFIALNLNVRSLLTRNAIIQYAPLAVMLTALLVLAFFFEQLRSILMHGVGLSGLFSGPQRTFGLGKYFSLRFSGDFWSLIWDRLKIAGPFNFALVYLAVILIANIVKREKRHLTLTVSALTAFFGGWLIFSPLYYAHDYYQLPVMTIIFLSFAISFSYLINALLAKISDQNRRQQAYAAILFALIPFSSYQVLAQNSLGQRSRVNFYSGLEYALRDENVFLHVSDLKIEDPRQGGLFSTKFYRTPFSEFESNCQLYRSLYQAILVDGTSPCLMRNKHLADYYIHDGNKTFFLDRKGTLRSKRNIAQRNIAGLRSNFNVYIDGDQIVYTKKECVENDIQAAFFLHIIPVNGADRPFPSQSFENRDFNFKHFGQIIDGVCIAVRDLPAYPIKEIRTGQYVARKGNIWEGVLAPITQIKYQGQITIPKKEGGKKRRWHDISNTILNLQGVMILFEKTSKAKSLELSLSRDDHYQLLVYKKGREQKRIDIEGMPVFGRKGKNYGSLLVRTIVLDKGEAVEFDAIKVVPIKSALSDQRYSLGHLIIKE